MDDDTRDWDDDLDVDQRNAVMNRTARAMGLTPRYGAPAPAPEALAASA